MPETDARSIEYSRLREADLNSINELRALFPGWSRGSLLEKIRKTQKGRDIRFVAKHGGVIVAHLKVVTGKGLHRHRAEMNSLTVFHPFRRQGIATVLTKYAMQNLPKRTTLVTLAVDRKNKSAIRLYKKLGFTQFGLLKRASKIDGKYVDNCLMSKHMGKK
jgi:ribosomal protein S18 acetylase RimI-like enzyme